MCESTLGNLRIKAIGMGLRPKPHRGGCLPNPLRLPKGHQGGKPPLDSPHGRTRRIRAKSARTAPQTVRPEAVDETSDRSNAGELEKHRRVLPNAQALCSFILYILCLASVGFCARSGRAPLGDGWSEDAEAHYQSKCFIDRFRSPLSEAQSAVLCRALCEL
jgi:hypothetical protein